MARRRPAFVLSLTFLLVNILSACIIPTRELPGIELRISQPLAGSVVPVAPLDVQGVVFWTGASPFPEDSANRMVLYANGVLIGEAATMTSSRASIVRTWTPPGPGEYTLQVQADIGRTYAISDPTRVCVVEDPASGPLREGIWGYTGLCDGRTRSEFTEPGEISMEALAYPRVLHYNPEGTNACPEYGAPGITFRALVTDPPDLIGSVIVDYEISSGGGSDIGALELYSVVDTTPGDRYRGYTGSLHGFLNTALPEGGPGQINWTARAYGWDWELLLTSGPHTIYVVPCDAPIAYPPSSIAAPPTPSATPGSDADCPPGTYYAPATHQCIAIQIVPGDSDEDKACKEPPGGCGINYKWNGDKCQCVPG